MLIKLKKCGTDQATSHSSTGEQMYTIADDEYMYLFSHCSNGSIAVTKTVLEDHVIPLLMLHGVEIISYYD